MARKGRKGATRRMPRRVVGLMFGTFAVPHQLSESRAGWSGEFLRVGEPVEVAVSC